MKPISTRDISALQDAILAFHSHRDIESFRRAVPGIFLGVIRAQQFSLADVRIDVYQRSVKVLDLWESPAGSASRHLEPMERNLLEHPFARHAQEVGVVAGALILSDFLTLPQLRRTRLYREALRPANVGRVMSIGSFGGPGQATLSLARPETEPDFTERDRHMFEMLRPHFEQARANLERETLLRANRTRSLKAHGLTPRETEVALWLAQGKSNAEIGGILAAPVRTVEKHVERILRKMGVENRSSAALAVAEIVRA